MHLKDLISDAKEGWEEVFEKTVVFLVFRGLFNWQIPICWYCSNWSMKLLLSHHIKKKIEKTTDTFYKAYRRFNGDISGVD